jgi:hypothetical protein
MSDRAFFGGFPRMASSFVDDDGVERKYQFPTFYEDSRGLQLIHSCSYEKARAALPGKRLWPVPVGLGRAAVAVAAFEYLTPVGIDPYQEVLMALPVIARRRGKLPGLALFVKRLIVDKAENVQRGKHIWGMDKSLGEFKFFDDGERRVCEVHRNGRRALRLEAPLTGRSRSFTERRTLVTAKDGSLLLSRSSMTGRRIDRQGQGGLVLGADAFAAELESLGVSPRPLASRLILRADHAMSLPLESEPLD